MIIYNIFGLIEPKGCELVKHCAFEWNGGENTVESGLPVGRYYDPFVISFVCVAHFSCVNLLAPLKIRFCKGVFQVRFDDRSVGHFFNFPSLSGQVKF